MIRKLCPVVVLFLAACSTTPSAGPKPGGETGGAGGNETTGGRGGNGGSAGTGGSGGGTRRQRRRRRQRHWRQRRGRRQCHRRKWWGRRGRGQCHRRQRRWDRRRNRRRWGRRATPATGYKFGARPQQYPMGSIKPTGDQGALDAAVKAAYDKWKAAHVKPLCGGYVVKAARTPEPAVSNPTTNSTALGNGMVITAMMAGHDPEAQTIFDGMFAVARKFPSILSHYVPPKHGIGPRRQQPVPARLRHRQQLREGFRRSLGGERRSRSSPTRWRWRTSNGARPARSTTSTS